MSAGQTALSAVAVLPVHMLVLLVRKQAASLAGLEFSSTDT